MKRTLILLATMLLLTHCASTVNRLDRGYSYIRAMQDTSPKCIWQSHQCQGIKGMFTRLASVR